MNKKNKIKKPLEKKIKSEIKDIKRQGYLIKENDNEQIETDKYIVSFIPKRKKT